MMGFNGAQSGLMCKLHTGMMVEFCCVCSEACCSLSLIQYIMHTQPVNAPMAGSVLVSMVTSRPVLGTVSGLSRNKIRGGGRTILAHNVAR